MILKYLTKGDHEQWNYIDGITHAATYFDEEHKCMMVALVKSDYLEESHLAIHDTAYLLNDKGQTIERIKM